MILAIDPGLEKCGIAILDDKGTLFQRKVCSRKDILVEADNLTKRYKISTVVIGSGTASKEIQKELIQGNLKMDCIFVPEKNTSLAARKYYWKEHPPKGLLRLIPTSLRVPSEPIDGYAAQIIGESYLKGASRE